MIALGLALVLIAAGATLFAVIASSTTSNSVELAAFGVTISATPLALFIAGALSVALLGLGLALVGRGTRRTSRTHRELKQLRKENAIAATRAEADRAKAKAAESTADTSAGSMEPGADKDAAAQPAQDAQSAKDAAGSADRDAAGPANKGTEPPAQQQR
jgi:uncharacterized protein HemX